MVLRRDHAQGYGKAMLRLLKHPTTLLNECVLRRGKTSRVMSALGQKQTLKRLQPMSALPPKADIGTQPLNVRFVPKADIRLYS